MHGDGWLELPLPLPLLSDSASISCKEIFPPTQVCMMWMVCTVVSQKRAHYGSFAHPPVLPRFPSEILKEHPHTCSASIGNSHCLTSLRIWFTHTIRCNLHSCTMFYTITRGGGGVGLRCLACYVMYCLHHFACVLCNTQYWYFECRPTLCLNLVWGAPPMGPLSQGYGIIYCIFGYLPFHFTCRGIESSIFWIQNNVKKVREKTLLEKL